MKERVFVAINLPQEVKGELAQINSKLKKKNKKLAIKWVRPESVHLTLNFLGYLEDGQIKKVWEILAKRVGECPVFQINIGHLGGFPHLHRPRVIYLECQEKTNQLKNCQKNLTDDFKEINLPTEERAWRPHLTLGRIKDAGGKIELISHVEPLSFTVKTIELMESVLKSTGAEYQIIKSFSLK